MKIKVSEIPDEGLEIDERTSLRPNEGETPAELKLRLQKQGPEVTISGSIKAQVTLVCGRCLKEFQKDTEIPVELVYMPVRELREEKHELEPDELDTGFYKEDEIDLDSIAGEQVLLSVPMKALCSDACKGICPKCGADLNAGECGCSIESGGGSKFADLKKFMKERS